MPKSINQSSANIFNARTVDKEFLYKALLEEQYFPRVKTDGEELPPFFKSDKFTEAVASELANISDKKLKSTAWVELRTRRFDGLVRRLGLPHPVTYSRLVNHIADNWKHLSYLIESDHSRIKPQWHEDGRLIHMNYESTEELISRHTQNSHGKHFLAKADISSCFPSIYSHAIDWALRGKKSAKKNRNDGSWQAWMDSHTANIHDGETKGLMIGPAVSNLLAEIVLQKVDGELINDGYKFTRYVDDYTAYCDDRSDAEQFIVKLNRTLSEYRLDINTKKTQIYDLWNGDSESWIQEIHSCLPAYPTPVNNSRFLRRSEMIAYKYKSKSVLKLAIKLLIGQSEKLDIAVSILEIDEMVRLCQFHPHLVPFLSHQLSRSIDTLTQDEISRIGRAVAQQLTKAADRDETDTALWYLYIARKILDCSLSTDDCKKLLEMNDDLVSVAIASTCCEHRSAVVDQVSSWDYDCESDYEKHWLARYELWRTNLLNLSDLSNREKKWMRIMKNHGIAFSELKAQVAQTRF